MVNRYNRGGGQQTGNAICILALNMINDKVIVQTNKQLNKKTNKETTKQENKQTNKQEKSADWQRHRYTCSQYDQTNKQTNN